MTLCVSVIDDYTRSAGAVSSSNPSLAPHIANATTAAALSALNLPDLGDVKKDKRTRKKAVKDPNAPKRPPSAYILFQNEVREKTREENQGLPYRQVLDVISQKWKGMPLDERKVSWRRGCTGQWWLTRRSTRMRTTRRTTRTSWKTRHTNQA